MAVRRSLLTLAALVALVLASVTPARAQTFISSGQLRTLSATGCVIIRTNRLGAAAITLGGTWTGTVNFDVNVRDEGVTATCDTGNGWVAKTFPTSIGGTAVSSTTAAGTWDGSIGGYALLRVRFTRSTGELDVTVGTGQGGGTGSGGGGGTTFDGVPLDAPGGDPLTNTTLNAIKITNPTAADASSYIVARLSDGSAFPSLVSNDLLNYRTLDLDETEEEVKATPGALYNVWFTNTATATRFLKCYNATAANVTVGTTTPVLTVGLPGNATDDIAGALGLGGQGMTFTAAITCAVTTAAADNDTGAPGAGDVIANIFYK